MTQWQRPSPAPIPWRQAAADRIRRVDPRRSARHLLVAMFFVVLAQLGWQWRSTTADLGRRQDVVVMQRPVSAGAVVTAADVTIVPWPVGLMPEGATAALPSNAIAAVDLVGGEVLVSQRLFPTADGLSQGQRLVTIAQPLAPPPLERGTRVELFGILPIGDGITSPATRLTTGTVIVVTDTAISLAVDSGSVPTVVEHSTLGTIEVVVLP